MALHPSDPRIIATGQVTHMGFLAPVLVWDLEARAIICSLSLHKVSVQALAFSPSGEFLATLGGEDDNNLVVWHVDVPNARGVAICGSPAAHDLALAVVWAKSSDDTIITAGRENLRVWTLDVQERKVRPIDCQLGQTRRCFTCLVVSDDDEHVYAGTESGDVLEVSIREKLFKRVGPKKRIPRQITAAALDFNGNLVLGSGDALTVVTPHEFKVVATIGPDQISGQVTSISASPSGELLVGTTLSNIYAVGYARDPSGDGAVLDTVTLKSTCHNDKINDVTFPKGYSDLFATCSGADIRIWHMVSGSELLRIQVPNLECNCINFNPKGSLILSGWSDGKVRAFGPQSGKLLFVINDAHKVVGVGNPSGGTVPANGVTALCVSHSGTRLITGGADGQVRVWKLESGAQVMIASMKEHRGPVNEVKMGSSDKECLSASADGSVIKWSLESFTRIAAVFGATFFTSVCYHPDESQFISSGTDHKITFWDSTDMAAVRILEGSETVRPSAPPPACLPACLPSASPFSERASERARTRPRARARVPVPGRRGASPGSACRARGRLLRTRAPTRSACRGPPCPGCFSPRQPRLVPLPPGPSAVRRALSTAWTSAPTAPSSCLRRTTARSSCGTTTRACAGTRARVTRRLSTRSRSRRMRRG
jgi:WD40 repeat protein